MCFLVIEYHRDIFLCYFVLYLQRFSLVLPFNAVDVKGQRVYNSLKKQKKNSFL